MGAGLERDLLKGVSRSFYLSLRLLPAPMRHAAGIAYLLARTSDTLADSPGIPADARPALLDRLASGVAGEIRHTPFSGDATAAIQDPRESRLLAHCGDILGSLADMPPQISGLIREVVAIIISGQKLDLKRFGNAQPVAPVPLASEAELDDYTWRVAGCVGVFWTKLGFATLGDGFSRSPQEELLRLGEDFGKGLQLVNILRDLPKDLAQGRCYLPVADPADREELMGCFSRWLAVAALRMECGTAYAGKLRLKRLRMATALPAKIGAETLSLLRVADWDQLTAGIRIPRRRVYSLLLGSLLRG